MSDKKDIRNLNLDEILKFCATHKLPDFRGRQIWEWLWKKRATSFSELTSLSKEVRKLLNTYFIIAPVKIHKTERSADSTIKYSFLLHDNFLVEGVLIPSKNRLTACISSQVGCSLDCHFCATGTLKLKRNLTAAEIYDQAFILNQEGILNFGKKLSNIVYMGMGEPLLNYKAVLNSINLITTNQGLSMSPKRITVSTAGISKMIKKLADDNVKFNLAISLHAASNEKRDSLMPINKRINIEILSDSINYFYEKTGTRITYEYILFNGINDSIDDARKLVALAKDTPCKINLIEYNNIDGIDYEKSSKQTTENFISYLAEKKIIVNLRKSKGDDIAAACGQLVNKLK